MPKKKRSRSNVVRIGRQKFHLNIGVIVFAVILIYLLVSLFSYATKKHISAYEVSYGQITESYTYTGLIVRTEKITESDSSGYVNYYMKEGDKAAKGDTVCSIDSDGSLSEKITESGQDTENISSENLAEILENVREYTENYSDETFQEVYTFKNDVTALITEDLYLSALEDYSEETQTAASNSTFSFVKAKKAGVVAYYTDGYEDLRIKNFTAADYAPDSYESTSLQSADEVSSGDVLFKTVTSEKWYVLFPITDTEAETYSEESVLTVTFREDGETCDVNASVKTYDDETFLVLKFNSSMVRYISKRYMEISVDVDDSTGLKIPVSSIISKEFYIIPKEYITKGGDSNSSGVLVYKDGADTAEFVETDLYYETDDGYYVDMNLFSENDRLQMPDSTEQLSLTQTADLEGVYCINQGYTVFRVIDILAENDDYAIVDTDTDYGISLYDHIALDAENLTEGEVVQ